MPHIATSVRFGFLLTAAMIGLVPVIVRADPGVTVTATATATATITGPPLTAVPIKAIPLPVTATAAVTGAPTAVPITQAPTTDMPATPAAAPSGAPALGVAAPAADVTVTSLVPGTAIALIGIDPQWLWNASAMARTERPVGPYYAQMQAMLNISVPSDILPWIGRAYLAEIPGPSASSAPDAVFYAEIRDPAAYQSAAARMKTEIGERPHMLVTMSTFDSHVVTHLHLGSASGPEVNFMDEPGWVVFSTDNAALHVVASAQAGDIPSMAANDVFSKAFGTVEATQPSIWGALWQASFLKAVNAGAGMPAAAIAAEGQMSDMSPAVTTLAVIDKDTNLRIDSISTYTDPVAIAKVAALRAKIQPITGDSLSHVPNDAVISLIASTPGAELDIIKNMIAKTPSAAAAMKNFDPFAMLAPVLPAIDAVTGEANLALCYKDGVAGVVGAFQTDSADTAQTTLTSLVAGLTKLGIPLKASGADYIFPSPSPDSAAMFSPIFGADGAYVRASNAAQWFKDPDGAPTLALPTEAVGSLAAAVGNFSFFDPMMAQMTKGLPPGALASSPMAPLLKLHLGTATWAAWSGISEDGQSSDSTFVLSNLDWKGVIYHVFLPAIINTMNAAPPTAPVHHPAPKAKPKHRLKHKPLA